MKVDFDKLAEAYLHGLVYQLRKFGAEEEFLYLWVHDEDYNTSLLSMLDSAHSSRIPGLNIEMTADSAKKVNFPELQNMTKDFATLRMTPREGKGFMIEAQFAKPQVKVGGIDFNDIPEMYKHFFNTYHATTDFTLPLKAQADGVVVNAEYEGCKLALVVKNDKHIVTQAQFSGATSEFSKKTFTALCELMVGKPLNEVQDHAVIYLEYKMRMNGHLPNTRGILLPARNGWETFKTLQKMVDMACLSYRVQQSYGDRTNFWAPQPADAWTAAPHAQQIKAIDAVAQFCRENEIDPADIVVMAVERNYKLIIDFNPKIGKYITSLLLKLEGYLREHVENTIVIYTVEEADGNRMRWDRKVVKARESVFNKKVTEGVANEQHQ